ncbi:MAG TPA: Uma2 family endonuclease [Gemmatimonadaceae bacterium]
MPAQKRQWTAEMARTLPDGGQRYEVLDEELFVSPAPSLLHQRAVGRLFTQLGRYAREGGIGEAFVSPVDVEFSPRRLVQPDVFVVPASSAPILARRHITPAGGRTALSLDGAGESSRARSTSTRASRSTGSWILTAGWWNAGDRETSDRRC